jgi:hypothetical protein
MQVVVVGRMRESAVGALLGATRITDPSNERTIYIAAGGLLLLAIALAVGTRWWWRTSKVEHPALGPLEVMGTRSWWRGDWSARSRRLDAARPAGAEPIAADADEVDLQAVASDAPLPFDDLADSPTAASADLSSLAELLERLHAEPAAAASDPASAAEAEVDAASEPPAPRAPIDPLLRPQSGA